MKKYKPRFIEYIKSQSYFYNVILENNINENKERMYYEANYNIKKLIIDTVLLILHLIIIVMVMILVIAIVEQYDDRFGSITMGQHFAVYAAGGIMGSILPLLFAPLLEKIIRRFFGLRWFCAKFNKASDEKETNNYLRFYNLFISFQSDRFFYTDNKIIKKMKEKLKKSCSFKLKTMEVIAKIYHILLIGIIYFSITMLPYGVFYRWFTLERGITILAISLFSTYILSHIFAYTFWKRSLKKA